MPASYSYVLGEAATNFALGLTRKEQHRLAFVFRALANTPHRTGDYTARPITPDVFFSISWSTIG